MLSGANSDSERVGGIIRVGRFLKFEGGFGHQLHLAFVSLAITGERYFYLNRREFVGVDAELFEGEEENAAGMGYVDGCFGVFGKKYFFDSGRGGLVGATELGEFVVYLFETVGQRHMGFGSNNTMIHPNCITFYKINNTETRCRNSGIKAQNPFSV